MKHPPGFRFRDREQAGRELARELARFQGAETVVVGLPRGGVPVAYEVARALEAPLDVCVVLKISAPTQPEVAVGAVAERGIVFVRQNLAAANGLNDKQLEGVVKRKRAEVAERVQRYRRGAPAVEVKGKTVVVVDDGVASGSTARAALRGLRQQRAGQLVLAVPVGPEVNLEELSLFADEVICLWREAKFETIAMSYEDFAPTTDEQVMALLGQATALHPI